MNEANEANEANELACEFVGISEELAELALQGQLVRLVCVFMSQDGAISTRSAGVGPSDLLGMLQVVQAVVMRKMLA